MSEYVAENAHAIASWDPGGFAVEARCHADRPFLRHAADRWNWTEQYDEATGTVHVHFDQDVHGFLDAVETAARCGCCPEKVVCGVCGSDDVRLDAWASWNPDRQEWVLAETFDHAHCNACEGEAPLRRAEAT